MIFKDKGAIITGKARGVFFPLDISPLKWYFPLWPYPSGHFSMTTKSIIVLAPQIGHTMCEYLVKRS